MLALSTLLVCGAQACRRKAPTTDAGPSGVPVRDSGSHAPDRPRAATEGHTSLAELASRLGPRLVTLVGAGEPTGGPLAALPAEPSATPWSGAPTDGNEAALGAGFVIDGQRLVVTSARVAGDAPSLTVRLGSGEVTTATVHGVDAEVDLAVLTLDRAARSTEPLPDCTRVRAGDAVAVIADPFGQGPTVTTGVVRSPRAPLRGGDLQPGLLALDAVVDAANWGGAVVDPSGCLVGMAVSSDPGSRVGLALPARELRRIAAALLEERGVSTAWIGLWVRSVEPARDGSATSGGLVVTRVVPDGPAAAAGILPDDVIVEFAGEPTSSPGELAALTAASRPGEEIPVSVARGGRLVALRVLPATTPR
jgi:S1-C subfamily serine protease